jgi:hypothetical protein
MLDLSNDSLNPATLNQFRQGYAAAILRRMTDLRGAANYEHFWLPLPDDRNSSVSARGTFDTRVKVADYAWIVAISGYSAQPEGCKLQLTDLGTGAAFFSKPVQLGSFVGGAGSSSGVSNILWFLPRPRLVLPPAELNVQIFNLAGVTNDLQIVLHLAQPANGRPRP